MKWMAVIATAFVLSMGAGSAQAVKLTNRQVTNLYRASFQAGFNYGKNPDHVVTWTERCPVVNEKVRCPILIKWRRNGEPGRCLLHVLLGDPGQNYGGYRWPKNMECLEPKGNQNRTEPF